MKTKAQTLLEEMKNPKKLPPNIRKKINAELHPIGAKYHNQIPFGDISDILKKYGLVVLQEDRTKWSGFLTGRDGNDTFDLGYAESSDDDGQYTVIDNSRLVMSWYKMSSGRYEIVVYVG